jgi:LDH2 family malate/lactate/ureidoglycolate dehydrogenase
MATSTVALGKVEMQRRKEEPIPAGWAVDSNGKETLDPNDVYKDGGLLPLGGLEMNSGYKGYGLAMMVELMCGVLSGGPFGPHVRAWKGSKSIANLGQTFIAVDPNCFAPGFEDRIQTFMDETRSMDPVNPSLPVKVAGDLSRDRMSKADNDGGITYVENMIKSLDQLAISLNVEPIKTN